MLRDRFKKIEELLHSRRGKNVVTFLVFLVISAAMWTVLSLNEELQRDIRCTVKITNLPDSVTRISPIPEAINVSVRARGTQLMRYWWSRTPEIALDYRIYKSGNRIQFGESALRAFFRSIVGAGSQVLAVSPDTLSISFTTRPGVKMPVKVDAKISTAPHYMLVGRPVAVTDTVTLYSLEPIPSKLRSLTNVPFSLADVNKSGTIKVPVKVPANSRAIPDSIEIAYEVQPLISKMRRVTIDAINVPSDIRLVTYPSQVDVYYMVPMDVYKNFEDDVDFKVQVDYDDIGKYGDETIPVELVHSPLNFTNVYLSLDSVEYIVVEKK